MVKLIYFDVPGQVVGLNDLNSYGSTKLIRACLQWQGKRASDLIEEGALLDIQEKYGYSALMCACRNSMVDTVELLIERGANLDLQQNAGWTALMFTCPPPIGRRALGRGEVEPDSGAMYECMKAVYQGGARLDLKNKEGMDALSLARSYGDEKKIAFLDFVVNNAVAKAIVSELKLPRSVAVAFYESENLTLEDCKLLSSEDLESLGILSEKDRQKAMERFSGKRLSLPKRLSKKLSEQAVKRISRELSQRSSSKRSSKRLSQKSSDLVSKGLPEETSMFSKFFTTLMKTFGGDKGSRK